MHDRAERGAAAVDIKTTARNIGVIRETAAVDLHMRVIVTGGMRIRVIDQEFGLARDRAGVDRGALPDQRQAGEGVLLELDRSAVSVAGIVNTDITAVFPDLSGKLSPADIKVTALFDRESIRALNDAAGFDGEGSAGVNPRLFADIQETAGGNGDPEAFFQCAEVGHVAVRDLERAVSIGSLNKGSSKPGGGNKGYRRLCAVFHFEVRGGCSAIDGDRTAAAHGHAVRDAPTGRIVAVVVAPIPVKEHVTAAAHGDARRDAAVVDPDLASASDRGVRRDAAVGNIEVAAAVFDP